MRPTSLLAWERLKEKLPQRRREVLTLVLQFPNRTAVELEQLAGQAGHASARHTNKRLAELERQGLIVASGMGEALCWSPVAEPPDEVRPVPKPLPRKQLEAVYLKAREYVAGRCDWFSLEKEVRKAG